MTSRSSSSSLEASGTDLVEKRSEKEFKVEGCGEEGKLESSLVKSTEMVATSLGGGHVDEEQPPADSARSGKGNGSRLPLDVEQGDDSGERPVPYVYLLTAIASLNSANLGFDIGVMSGAASYVQEAWDLSDPQLEILIGILNGCAIAGAMIAHVIVDRLGRRKTFMATCAVFVVGVAGMALSPSYEVLLTMRVVTGVGVGMGLSIDPVYIAEVAPKKFRGALVTWSEISINVGILIGFVVSFLFRNRSASVAWRYMLGCGIFAPTLLLILTIFVMPESPRWLVANGKEQEARKVLNKLTHPWEDRAAIVRDIHETVVAEQSAIASWYTVFHPPTVALRRALLTGVGVAIAQQIMAEESLLFYFPTILHDEMEVGRTVVFYALIAMGFLKTICIIISACFLDTRGRRPMLLISVAGMAASLAGIALSFELDSPWGTVTGIWTYMGCFSLGIGPVCWLLASEVFPLSVRAKGMALATVSNRMFSTIIASSFVSWYKTMGLANYFWFFATVACCVWLAIFLYVPETKGKSLEEMRSVFEDPVKPAAGNARKRRTATEAKEGGRSSTSRSSSSGGSSMERATTTTAQSPQVLEASSSIENPMVAVNSAPISKEE